MNLLVPDPEPDPQRPGKFLHYDGCKDKGSRTSEKYTPSREKKLSKQGKTGLNSQSARGYVSCLSCEKPRVYYSAKRLSKLENANLQIALNGIDFRCGSPIVSNTHPNPAVTSLYGKVVTNTSLACCDHTGFAYYSKIVGKLFPIACSGEEGSCLQQI